MANHELGIKLRLDMAAIDAYLPVYAATSTRDHNGHRLRTGTRLYAKPLFAGYLFARFAPESRAAVLDINGVIEILKYRSEDGLLRPYEMRDDEMEQVRELEAHGAVPATFTAGEAVTVPFAGSTINGVVRRTKDGDRIVVHVALCGRVFPLEIAAGQVRRAAA